jgi:hypothetical protein
MKNLAVYALLSILALAVTGCSSKYMKPAGADAAALYAPSSDKAVIIFMRPSSLGERYNPRYLMSQPAIMFSLISYHIRQRSPTGLHRMSIF